MGASSEPPPPEASREVTLVVTNAYHGTSINVPAPVMASGVAMLPTLALKALVRALCPEARPVWNRPKNRPPCSVCEKGAPLRFHGARMLPPTRAPVIRLEPLYRWHIYDSTPRVIVEGKAFSTREAIGEIRAAGMEGSATILECRFGPDDPPGILPSEVVPVASFVLSKGPRGISLQATLFPARGGA